MTKMIETPGLTADNPFLHNLRIRDITEYLKKSGWKPVKHPNNRLLVFEGFADFYGDPIELVLPRHEHFRDTYIQLADAINLLAAIEEESPDTIIQKIQIQNRDLLKLSILNDDEGNFPSLERATEIMLGSRNLIIYAACAEEEKRPYFDIPLKSGKDQAKKWQFGHTFHGSFGFTFESPVHQLRSFDVLPSSRQLVERIARGFSFLQEAVEKRDHSILLSNYQSGFNANICEALLEIMGKTGRSTLEYRIIWSKVLPLSEDIKAFNAIRLENKAYEYLQNTARELRAMDPIPETIKGKIVDLKSNDPLDSNQNRTITIEIYEVDRGKLQVKVSLTPQDYTKACDAHRDGHKITVKGLLSREGKTWRLTNPTDFGVI